MYQFVRVTFIILGFLAFALVVARAIQQLLILN